MFHIQKRRENPVITVISSDTGMLPCVAPSNTAHRIVFEIAPVVVVVGGSLEMAGGSREIVWGRYFQL